MKPVKVLHWAIIIVLSQEFLYARYMIFFQKGRPIRIALTSFGKISRRGRGVRRDRNEELRHVVAYLKHDGTLTPILTQRHYSGPPQCSLRRSTRKKSLLSERMSRVFSGEGSTRRVSSCRSAMPSWPSSVR
jgi:hypothetical protein